MPKKSHMYFMSCPRCKGFEFTRHRTIDGVYYYDCVDCDIAYTIEQLDYRIFWPGEKK